MAQTGRPLLQVISPMGGIIARETADAATSFLGETPDKPLTVDIIRNTARRAAEEFSVVSGEWTNTRPAETAWKRGDSTVKIGPEVNASVASIMGPKVRRDVSRRIWKAIQDVLNNHVGNPINQAMLDLVQDEVEASAGTGIGAWICTYSRLHGEMRWYNVDTGEWGDPC